MAVSATGETEPPPRSEEPAGASGDRARPFEVDPSKPLFYRFARSLILRVLRMLFRPKITGRDHVPPSGHAIIAPVHRSNIDFAFPGLLTKRKLFYMAKEELWTWGWFGRLLESFGVFPVHRSGADRESIRRAEEVLRRGELLVMFPEGSRRFGDRVEELQEGVAFMAARTGAPIVPVGIFGTEEAMPKGAKLPKPTRVRVVVGEAISVEASEGRRVARSQIHQLSEALRERLQAVYDEAAGR
jgi:1-acyl-sn-glycerol-3-phosphate acyltransferase